MASTAIRALGSTIARLDTTVSPNTYNTINNITGFPAPSPEAPDIDVSDLGSSAREYLVGLKDNGEITLTGFYNPNDAEHGVLQAAAGNADSYTFRITLADVSPQQTIDFTARVKAFRIPPLEVDGAVPMEIVLRTTGTATWS